MRSGWVAYLSGLVGILTVTVTVSVPVSAQDAPPDEDDLINLFFDCQTMGCFDFDFFRREVPFVNWVRNREDAAVHVLVTSQGTGGGGQRYTLAFIGRDDFEGEDLELTVSTAGDAVQDEQRRAVVERLKVGLVRYVAGTPAADGLRVSLPGLEAGPGGLERMGGLGGPRAASQEDDPWNFWVFRVGGNARANGESTSSSSNYSGSLSANRTTEEWKFTFSARYSRRESKFDVGDDQTVTSLIEDWSATSLLVKSLTPQWSLGMQTGTGRSTRRNENFRWNVSPGIEFNFFPYSESSRRSLTLQALMNVRHWNYESETIFGETQETRVAASLTAAINQVQPWGRATVSLTGSQYLHDSDLYRVSLGGFVQVRLFRGFSVNMNGNYSWIRDQLFPTIADATTEEILLRQRQLQTSFSYFTSFGISYQFGSIFNNVVNPRFGGGNGFFFFM